MRLFLFFVSISLLFTSFLVQPSYANMRAVKVKLTWDYNNPPPDLKGFIVYKQVNSSNSTEEQFKPIWYVDDPTARSTTFQDVIDESKPTVYAMKAVDEAGQLSDMSETAEFDPPPFFAPIIKSVRYDNSTKSLVVEWFSIMEPSDFKEFKIYVDGQSVATITDHTKRIWSGTLSTNPGAIEVAIVDNNDNENTSYPYLVVYAHKPNVVPSHIQFQLIGTE